MATATLYAPNPVTVAGVTYSGTVTTSNAAVISAIMAASGTLVSTPEPMIQDRSAALRGALGAPYAVEVLCVGDGSDESALFSEAAYAVHSVGGGEVRIPAGTYRVQSLPILDRVRYVGKGAGVTILKAVAGSNADVFVSPDFDALTNTGSLAGAGLWGIHDLEIDGDKASNLTGGYGIRAYGWSFRISGVFVHDCRIDGMWLEWTYNPGHPIGGDRYGMEAWVRWCKSCKNGRNGFTFYGPHDSQVSDVFAWDNPGKSFWVTGTANSGAGGLHIVNAHAYGVQEYAFHLERSCLLSNIQAEGASAAQIFVGAEGIKIKNAKCFLPAGSGKGMVIGANPTHYVRYCQIDAHLVNCEFARDYSGGGNVFNILCQNDGSKAAYSGTESGGHKDQINIDVIGGSTMPSFRQIAGPIVIGPDHDTNIGGHSVTISNSLTTQANFRGSGATVKLYDLTGPSDPYSGWGAFTGTNISSPVAWMYDAANNAFEVRKVPNGSTPASGTLVSYIDRDGNFGSIGTFFRPFGEGATKPMLKVNGAVVDCKLSDDSAYTGLRARFISSSSVTPTRTIYGAAGAGATLTVTGSDAAGQLSFVTGTGTSAGNQFLVTFSVALGGTARISLSPRDAATAGQVANVYATGSTTGFTVAVASPLTASASYNWDYTIITS